MNEFHHRWSSVYLCLLKEALVFQAAGYESNFMSSILSRVGAHIATGDAWQLC